MAEPRIKLSASYHWVTLGLITGEIICLWLIMISVSGYRGVCSGFALDITREPKMVLWMAPWTVWLVWGIWKSVRGHVLSMTSGIPPYKRRVGYAPTWGLPAFWFVGMTGIFWIPALWRRIVGC